MPKWKDIYAGNQARKAGLKPGSNRYKAYKYTVLRKITKKEKKK